jgi:hypothetical protein
VQVGATRLVRVLVILGAGVALVPAILPFTAAVNADEVCIAARDGWHRDRAAPPQGDIRAVEQHLADSMPTGLTEAELQEWVEREREFDQRQDVEAAYDYISWRAGPGACVPESRHRLILSGSCLVLIAAIVASRTLASRTRRGSHDHQPSEVH